MTLLHETGAKPGGERADPHHEIRPGAHVRARPRAARPRRGMTRRPAPHLGRAHRPPRGGLARVDRPRAARAVVGARAGRGPRRPARARPGGALVTRISDDGVEFGPHIDAGFLVLDEPERLDFANAVDSGWRPTSRTRSRSCRDHHGRLVASGDRPPVVGGRVVVRPHPTALITRVEVVPPPSPRRPSAGTTHV
jgi:hypothetical protein